MNRESCYLALLKKLISQMKVTILNKEKYSENVYNCILAGIVIQANAIVESTMLDFHTAKFDKVAAAIYNSRQFLVHYSDYRTFSNIEDISKDIIEKFNKVYKGENDFVNYILKFDKHFERNVVVEKRKNIVYDEFTDSYIFKHDNCEIAISKDKITVIKDLRGRKDVAYIVNCENPLTYLVKGEDYSFEYKELTDYISVQDFFSKHFNVTGVDYNLHNEFINDVIDNFYKKGYNATHIFEYKEIPDKRTLSLETSKVLRDYFFDGVVYKQFLDKRVFVNKNNVLAKDFVDYHDLKVKCSPTLTKHIGYVDYFFINKTISIFNHLKTEIESNKELTSSDKSYLMLTTLINWVDHTLKNLSNDFSEAYPDFAKLHQDIINYRNYFAHNIAQMNPLTLQENLQEFYQRAKGYTMILNSLEINALNEEDKQNVKFVEIERKPEHFLNYKYEQFVRIDPLNYVGNKLYYSSRGDNYDKIISLIPADSKYHIRAGYYEMKKGELVAKTFKTKGGKKKSLLVSQGNYNNGKNITFDVKLLDLLHINAAFRGKVDNPKYKNINNNSHKNVIIFPPTSENNRKGRACDLDQIIFDFYQQRYIPLELTAQTRIKLVKNPSGYDFFKLINENGKEIAYIVDEKTFRKMDIEKTSRDQFSVTMFKHDFSKRRN